MMNASGASPLDGTVGAQGVSSGLRANQITYAYGSLIKTDSLYNMCCPASGAPTAPAAVCQNGVMDFVLHPIEPLAVGLTLVGNF